MQCVICGEEADRFFANNPNIPLCPLASCEVALIDTINAEIREVVESQEKETE